MTKPEPHLKKKERDLHQRNCERCGKRAVKIDRDKYAKRYCVCGNEWYFDWLKAKKKVEQGK